MMRVAWMRQALVIRDQIEQVMGERGWALMLRWRVERWWLHWLVLSVPAVRASSLAAL